MATAMDAADAAFAAIQLNDDLDEAEVRRRAYEMERRADEQWRSMHTEQRRRNEEAELKARPTAEQVASQAESRRQQALEQQARERQQRALAEGSSSDHRGDDEADAAGWTLREQRGLQAALRTCPAKDFASAGARWQAVAAQLPGRTAKECLQRCKQLAAAVKAHRPSPLVRLEADVLLLVLERLSGFALCTAACVCKELRSAARDEVLLTLPLTLVAVNPIPNPALACKKVLWMPFAEALPSSWAYSARDRGGEPAWRYTLRMREGLYGSWRMMTEHREGRTPYLREMGRVEHTLTLTLTLPLPLPLPLPYPYPTPTPTPTPTPNPTPNPNPNPNQARRARPLHRSRRHRPPRALRRGMRTGAAANPDPNPDH
jgi:hypothetical protein